MNLVIVESPTKARTIVKFLGSQYTIKASMGHIVDLPKSTLGVDIEHDFSPQYETVKDKKQVISDLKSAAKQADSIILATDPDREGEAIASHIRDVLSSNSKFQRIVFHEITKEAIEEALSHPRSIDENLVSAQTARRVLDRLVGYKLSPLLWQKVRRGLSAGRVQSVALRLIVEREREIEKFKKENYWTIHVILNLFQAFGSEDFDGELSRTAAQARRDLGSNKMLKQVQHDKEQVRDDNTKKGTEFELIEINGEKIEIQEKFNLYDGEYTVSKTTIASQEKAEEIVKDLQSKTFSVSDVLQKETQRSPQPPYTTSTLQQDAARRLGFSGKRTMRVAQKLYEEGFITYHRTDSVVMGNAALFAIRKFAQENYGQKYVPEKPRFYATKQKLAQEAHEAIRPTSVGQISNIKYQISNITGNDGWKLYELIWRRAVASQMNNAVIESTTVIVDAYSNVISNSNNVMLNSFQHPVKTEILKQVQHDKEKVQHDKEKRYTFKATGSVLLFDGFLKVNPQALSDNQLPQFTKGEALRLVNASQQEHETPPPPRYNDASLIKTLEEKGIGRPSTYAPIISTIEDRRYVERSDSRFVPTPVGVAVNDFLVQHFSDIDDIPFTAEMEDSLDTIADGKKEWVSMMRDFYGPFEKKLQDVKGAERVKIEVEQTDEKCEKCGSPMVVRVGRFGKFLSCSQFPKCGFTKPFIEETQFTCPKDGGKVIVKKTRKGRKFFGCSNYPKCNFAAWKLEDIKKGSG